MNITPGAHITKRLITEHGFNFITVEGDWPDCYRVNRFVKGYDNDNKTAFNVLHAFNRWPTWMWANWEIVGLIEWLLRQNTMRNCRSTRKWGFMDWMCIAFGKAWKASCSI